MVWDTAERLVPVWLVDPTNDPAARTLTLISWRSSRQEACTPQIYLDRSLSPAFTDRFWEARPVILKSDFLIGIFGAFELGAMPARCP
jgi:hypothetical protein